ncbi:MAG TPA: amino acid permease [Gemmatimonadaceae bacterium]
MVALNYGRIDAIPADSMNRVTESGLVRGIGRWDFLGFAINASIGAGIFGLPGRIYALTGMYSLLAFFVSAALMILIILCFVEVAGRFRETGGPYLYARETFGPFVGFQVGWLLWLTRMAGFAAISHLFVNYVGYFWPAASSGATRISIIAALVVGLTTINYIGVRPAALASDFFTVAKVIPLLLFVGVGVFFIDKQRLSFGAPPDYGSFFDAVLLLVFMFMGFEGTLIPSGEIEDPERTIPFSLLGAVAGVALLCTAIQVVCIGTLPTLADSERPLTDAGRIFLGGTGASVITTGALLSMLGILHLSALATPRLPFAMAERGQLPQILSRTHSRFHTPHVALLLTAAMILGITLSGTFIYAVTISVIIRLIVYAITCAALPVLRRRSDKRDTGFTVPGGTLVSITSFILCILLISNSGWREARDAGIAVVAGFVLYFAYRLRARESLRSVGKKTIDD